MPCDSLLERAAEGTKDHVFSLVLVLDSFSGLVTAAMWSHLSRSQFQFVVFCFFLPKSSSDAETWIRDMRVPSLS